MKIMKKLAVLLPLTAIIVSCGQSGFSSKPLGEIGEKRVYSESEIQSKYIGKYVPKIQTFASRFISEFIKTQDGGENIASSSLSVIVALAIAAECTGGETRQEILDALGMTIEEVRECASMIYNLNNQERFRNSDDGVNLVTRELLTNSIWLLPEMEKNEDTIKHLTDDYYCYPFDADFKNNNKEVNEIINSFISEKTYGLIDGGFNFNEYTRMIILNTLYLKDSWIDGATFNYYDKMVSFINKDLSITNKKLLTSHYVAGRTYEEETFTHFYVPTDGSNKLKFIVPQEGYSIDDVFTPENIDKVVKMNDYRVRSGNNEYLTSVKFPEFEAESFAVLDELLNKKFNLNTLFDPELCDFSNLTNFYKENGPKITVAHKAKVGVDKLGIEAAAVTIMVDTSTSYNPDIFTKVYQDYIVDRAFGYVITDSNNVPLFSGVVNKI